MSIDAATMSWKRPLEHAEATSGSGGNVSRSYPRKRVAIACDVCRIRKTRCDAAKPSCSFCTDSGIECRYAGPSQDDRRSERDTDYTGTLKRLDELQNTLDAVAAAVGASNRDAALARTPSIREGAHLSTSPASYTTNARRQPISRMPNLFVFKAVVGPHAIDSWSYECTKDFFRHQMIVEENLCEAAKVCNVDVNLSRPHLWRLQRSFVENILIYLPLFDHKTAAEYLQKANLDNYEDDCAQDCLVLLMYANGALSMDTSLYRATPLELPGFDYYARAVQALRRLPRSGEDLRVLQCHVLLCMYLLLAMRPLEAWKMIRQASQTCIFLLKADVTDQRADYKESFNRLYWICYVYVTPSADRINRLTAQTTGSRANWR